MQATNCNAFARELRRDLRHPRELSPDLERHAAHCPRCRRLWEERVLLDRAIAHWRGSAPGVDLTGRVFEATPIDIGSPHARRDSIQPAAPGRRRAPLAVSIAGMALFAAGAALWFFPAERAGTASTRAIPAEPIAARSQDEPAGEGAILAKHDTITLVAELAGYVPGPWELAALLGEDVPWSAGDDQPE